MADEENQREQNAKSGFRTEFRTSFERKAALPERRVTVHTGHMGYTIGLFAGEQKCPGRSVTPWMERLKFVARLLDGDKMAGLCREFGISRKTGYKILTGYNEIVCMG
jgi:hypothetical protein